MRPTLPILCLLAALTGCQSAPKPSPGLASLRVNVVAEPKAGGPLVSRAPVMYDQPGMTAAPQKGVYETVDYDNVEDIIVYLEPARTSAAPPKTIDVNPATTAGAIIPVSVGQKLTFRHAGAHAIPLYSVSEGNEFDVKTLAAGKTADYTVQSPGLVEVLTDPAKDPVLRLYAAPSRFVAATKSGKSVDFTDVPPGSYTVVAWHPRLPSGQTAVTLTADQPAKATLKVGVNALPKVGAR